MRIFKIYSILVLCVASFASAQPIKPSDIPTDSVSKSGLVHASLTGGRSKAAIMKVVMRNLPEMRKQYQNRLIEKPDIYGKITVKFAIDEYGAVIFSSVIESTVEDSVFEHKIADMIKLWQFEKIDKAGDVTEVIYPFVFSSGDEEPAINLEIVSGSRSIDSIMAKISAAHYTPTLARPSRKYGKVNIMFSIDQEGNILPNVICITQKMDTVFERKTANIIKGWKFNKAENVNDTTIVKGILDYSLDNGTISRTNKEIFGYIAAVIIIVIGVIISQSLTTQPN